MTIPSSKLEIWSKQGATDAPKTLREKIERNLKGDKSKIQQKDQLKIFLQGSYRNSTNIHGNSDVDVVVQHDTTFSKDISNLKKYEVDIYESVYSPATYSWEEFKREVVKTLCLTFGVENVEIGNKSIKIDGGEYEADVIPCFEHRDYLSFGSNEENRIYTTGIKFYTTKDNRPVINYPKKHYQNGSEKNTRVNGFYKPTIRIFKNFKRKLVEQGAINKEQAPSYFVENLLYNVPNEYYDNPDVSDRVYNILKWLNGNKSNYNRFNCQNAQVRLFGNTPEQWNEKDAKKFVSSVINLWNEW
ncbi:MAG: nucleotidyltransferase [Staphylococcus equorum]|nr:nucleotidyltransferase [Staphylococcus equorum]